MKKVIIADDIRSLLEKEKSFLDRSNIRILTSVSNKEALNLHRTEKADLIITNFSEPNISGEEFCSLVRESEELRKVSIIIVCSDNKSEMERISQCRANAFITTPINTIALLEKAHQLLNIPKREAYRAPISVSVEGKYENKPFLCYSENVSNSGMLFVTEKILSKGDIILCSFILPNSIHIITNAEIIRVSKKITEFDTNQYGIKFSSLDAKSRLSIKAFVEETSKKKQGG